MANPKEGKNESGGIMHYSAGAIIESAGKYLLIDRATPPFGFAGVGGHIDEGEEADEAVRREIEEEVGLQVERAELLYQEFIDWNWCNRGVTGHYWNIYHCSVKGEIKENLFEAKSSGWYSKEEIAKLELEPVWAYWFKKAGIC